MFKIRNIIAFVSIICAHCYAGDPMVEGSVLTSGQTVRAMNKNGTVKISYISPIKRQYEWDGRTRVMKLIPRAEVFDGRRGLYEPADSWGINPFEIRLVLEEAVWNFDNEESMYNFLREGSNYMDWVYTCDGLVLGLGRTPSRKQINISLWQILLNKKKPANLKGARPDRIALFSGGMNRGRR